MMFCFVLKGVWGLGLLVSGFEFRVFGLGFIELRVFGSGFSV